MGRDYQERGVGFVAINSNDIVAVPADNMQNMQQETKSVGYTFPYLLDESQFVAHAYDAACTPDFYLFDSKRKLIYRGQLDGSRPSNAVPVDGKELRSAINAAINGEILTNEQKPSIGCNIKWRPGNEPV